MPAIPTYEQQIDARGSIGTRASPDDFGGQVAAGLGNLAAGAESAYMGTQIRDKADAAVLKEQDERQARTWSGSVASQAMVDWAQNLEDRKKAAAPGAPGFTPSLLTDFDAYTTKLVDSAPTSYARQFLTDHMSQLRAHVGQQAVTFQAGAVYTQNVDNADKTIDNSAKVVQQDPTQYALTMQMIKSTMPEVGGAKQAELTNAATKQLTTAAASSTLDRDPYGLKAATGKAMGEGGFSGPTGIPWVDDATPEQVNTWNKLATARISQLENAKQTDADARERVAQTSFNALQGFVAQGSVPDLDYMARVKTDTAGTSFEASANAALDVATRGAGFGSASLPAQQARLEQLQAQAATGTDPEHAALATQLQQIHSTQVSAYKEDPIDAAVKYAHAPAMPTAQITSVADGMALIAARAPGLPTVEAASGGPASPLHPQEAQQLGKLLRSMQPDQAASALSAMGQAIGSGDRITAFAKQIGDTDGTMGLAMAYAGDRTTLGRNVSELLLRGDQALKDKRTETELQKQENWRATAATEIRGAFSDADVENKAIDAAIKINAATALNGQDDMKAAVRMATGGIATHGASGGKIPLPYGMNADVFEKKLSTVTPAMLSAQVPDGVVHVGPATIPLDKFVDSLKDATLVHAGQGLYNVRGGTTLATNSHGQRITIRITQ